MTASKNIMKKVFVNGYGSIGSRITKFIKDDPDIDVVGIGKHSSNEKVQHVICLLYTSDAADE